MKFNCYKDMEYMESPLISADVSNDLCQPFFPNPLHHFSQVPPLGVIWEGTSINFVNFSFFFSLAFPFLCSKAFGSSKNDRKWVWQEEEIKIGGKCVKVLFRNVIRIEATLHIFYQWQNMESKNRLIQPSGKLDRFSEIIFLWWGMKIKNQIF